MRSTFIIFALSSLLLLAPFATGAPIPGKFTGLKALTRIIGGIKGSKSADMRAVDISVGTGPRELFGKVDTPKVDNAPGISPSRIFADKQEVGKDTTSKIFVQKQEEKDVADGALAQKEQEREDAIAREEGVINRLRIKQTGDKVRAGTVAEGEMAEMGEKSVMAEDPETRKKAADIVFDQQEKNKMLLKQMRAKVQAGTITEGEMATVGEKTVTGTDSDMRTGAADIIFAQKDKEAANIRKANNLAKFEAGNKQVAQSLADSQNAEMDLRNRKLNSWGTNPWGGNKGSPNAISA
ncbi:hypothetical protein FRB96_004239 [Tulasnella sp. 330]|nr:hypothetical protein FRB96_004239 [Tulasnella sp. 330]KAG8875433.1 hypothetical protein FRB97_005084 [Tulasnella sp. 331]KAG8880679.1 hypothetical protein FRB98_004955 [Tulasnella sp. 332]